MNALGLREDSVCELQASPCGFSGWGPGDGVEIAVQSWTDRALHPREPQ